MTKQKGTVVSLTRKRVLVTCPDIGLARQLLSWEPAVRLDARLTRTIAYFDHLLGERGSRPAATFHPAH